MLIDDEKDILRVIKRGLELNEARPGVQFKVDTYRDTESALRSFRDHPAGYYNLILTDLRMTKSGFELYRVMKEKSPDLKFAFLTAYDTIDKQQFANYLSDIDPSIFITKPITISRLRQRLINIIDS